MGGAVGYAVEEEGENSRVKERKRGESAEKGCERGRKRVWRAAGARVST